MQASQSTFCAIRVGVLLQCAVVGVAAKMLIINRFPYLPAPLWRQEGCGNGLSVRRLAATFEVKISRFSEKYLIFHSEILILHTMCVVCALRHL